MRHLQSNFVVPQPALWMQGKVMSIPFTLHLTLDQDLSKRPVTCANLDCESIMEPPYGGFVCCSFFALCVECYRNMLLELTADSGVVQYTYRHTKPQGMG